MEEPISEKIRNQLSPYWNLVELIEKYNKTKDPKIWDFVMKANKLAKDGQSELLELVDKATNI